VAALTPTFLTGKLPVGHKVDRTFRVSVTSNAAADEWVDTGLTFIDAIVGWAYIGQAAPTQAGAAALEVPVFRKNAQGTGVAEGTNPGDLAIEVASGDVTIEITVRGKA
jgi:hypothetical protein